MRKLILFLIVILSARIALAAPPTPGTQTLRSESGQVNIETGAAKNIELSTNNTKHWIIDGTTGNLAAQAGESITGAGLSSPILASPSFTGDLLQSTSAGGNILFTRLGASSTGQYAVFGGGAGSTAFNGDIISSQTPTLLISQQPSAGNLDWSGMVGRGATANGPRWDYLKTRSTSNTLDANTVVNNADELANIRFFGSDGVNYSQAAAIVVKVDGTPGASDMPGSIDFQTSPDGSATPVSVLKLDNAKLATFAGGIKSTATNVGWTVRSAANTACDTTCTAAHGCLFGYDITTTALVACSNAAADSCVCSF